jgi:hypothetical protein
MTFSWRAVGPAAVPCEFLVANRFLTLTQGKDLVYMTIPW